MSITPRKFQFSACSILAGSLLLATPVAAEAGIAQEGAAVSPASAVTLAPSSSILPVWAKQYNRTGQKEIWLVPLYGPRDTVEWDNQQLLASANKALARVAVMSGGRMSASATRVLEPTYWTPKGTSDCNGQAWEQAQRVRQLMPEMKANPNLHIVFLSRVKDCPFGGMGATPGQHLIVTYSPVESAVRGDTLLHELGHNWGLPHAAGYRKGGLLSVTSSAGRLSSFDQYGDATDLMGSSYVAEGLGAASAAALGWGDGVLAADTSLDVDVTVDVPERAGPGADALVLPDPVSGKRYLVSYLNMSEKVLGVDKLRGIFLHEINDETDGSFRGDRSYTTYLPWTGFGIGAGVGAQWVSPGGGLMFRVEGMNGTSAQVLVRSSSAGALKDEAPPVWAGDAPSVGEVTKSGFVLSSMPAWDQSGVRYKITIDGKRSRSFRPQRAFPLGKMQALVKFPRLRKGAPVPSASVVRVVVSDRLGNSFEWTTGVPRPR